ERWAEAGAAGLFLEDQVWPKRCGHMAGKAVVERGDWLAKLRAVLDADTGLHITARTDARAVVDLDEAIDRARAAAALGVDAVFVEAPESIDEMVRVAEALPEVTLVANMVETGRTPLLTPTELAELGYHLVVSPLTGLLSMTKALESALGRLAVEGSLRDHLDELASFEHFGEVVDLAEHVARADRYN
ncbi:MAG: isocitrate lyase/phosphoenolpyruvate mutase family protein, partial [Acidimicrobiia bacterium]|nr:isocitrate lyase/phosphoenolpyruvate mutase family protein [Acidimicrobiia bacterium]